MELGADTAATPLSISSMSADGKCAVEVSDNMPPASIEPPEEWRSAAAKVFDIPELLENILLQVSHVEDNAEVRHTLHRAKEWPGYATEGLFPDPAYDLFVLQRVNSTFQATILRNKTLQRRMFLAPYAEGTVDLNPHNTLRWLVEKIGVASDYGCGMRMYDDMERLDTLSVLGMGGDDNSEASWRKMKLHSIEGTMTIEVVYFDSSSQNETLGKFQYEDNMTLGKLHDGLGKLSPFISAFEGGYRYHEDDDHATTYKRLVDACAQPDLWK